MNENEKRRCFYIVALILMLVFMLLIGYGIYQCLWEKEEKQIKFGPDDLKSIVGYMVTDDQFMPCTDDPQLWLKKVDGSLRRVSFQFSQPLTEDMGTEIYYAQDYDFSQLNMAAKGIKAGETEFTVTIHKGDWNTLRVDFNNSFQLSQVVCVYEIEANNPMLLLLCIGAAVVISFVLFLWLSRKDRLFRFFVYLFQKIKETAESISISKIFLFFGIIGGVIMSFLLPLYQVPDEYIHFQFMQDELGLVGYAENADEIYFQPISASKIRGDSNAKQDFSAYVKYSSVRFDEALQFKFSPNLKILRHLAACIGLVVGILFDLPIYWCLQLAELFALAWYIFVGWLALKYMPFKKELLCFVMLLPMSLQQAGSINYDSMLLSTCFFLFSYICYLAYKKESVGGKDMGILLACLLVIMLTKAIYVLMIFLVLLIPRSKYKLTLGKCNIPELIYKFRWAILTVGICICFVGLYCFRNHYYIKILLSCFLDIPHLFCMLFETLKENWEFYMVSAIGYFGWFDCCVSLWFCVFAGFVFLFLLITPTGERGGGIRKRSRCLLGTIFLAISLLIFISMISHTILLQGLDFSVELEGWRGYVSGIMVILGVQGRYFIPIIPLLAIGCSNLNVVWKRSGKPIIKWRSTFIYVTYYVAMVVHVTYVLLERYWYSMYVS